MTRPFYLIGAGGTGSILFPLLLRYLDAWHSNRDKSFTLTVIDGKEVAASKLERQLFFGRHAGNPKATALIEQYECDPSVVIAVPKYLDDDNIRGIEEDAVILIAADNFPVRARIEAHAQSMDNVTVINGGNEMTDGSLQLYVRRNGMDITPPMSQGHPELLRDDGRDPARLDCQQIAELPSGEQLVMANSMSASLMLNAIRLLLDWDEANGETLRPLPHEIYFDLDNNAMRATERPTA